MGGDLGALLLDLVETAHDGAAADRQAARSIGAHPERHPIGVAVDDVDILHRDAEMVRHHLREGGLMALAVAVAAHEHAHLAGRLDAHHGALEQAGARAERADHRRRRDAARLDVGGKPDAEVAALGAGGRLPGAERFVADHLQRLVQHAGVVAAVVLQRHLGLVAGLLDAVERRDEVAPAQLAGIDPQLVGGRVDQPLQHIGGLGPPGAAQRVHRHGVGEHRGHVHIDRRRGVQPLQQRAVQVGRHTGGEGRQVGSHVGVGSDPQAGERAVRVEPQLRPGHMVAALRVGDEALAALRGPLDRALELARAPDRQHLFRVVEDLAAETARRRRATRPAPCARAGPARTRSSTAGSRAGSAMTYTAL